MRKLFASAAALAVLLGVSVSQPTRAQSYVGRAPAPEFPAGLDWINTDHALTLSELEGKIVLLDFWTYGCINCIHVIPELQALEERYPNELVVIGVHSAKFLNESETRNIRQVAQRYGRTHPIVNDRAFDIWRAYGIRAWPSFVFIDPEGNVLGRHEGEGIYDLFDEVIAGMIETFAARGTLDRTPLVFDTEATVEPRTALRFPGQIEADAATGRLFIADSGHDRIVVTDFAGVVLDVIGSGAGELRDGSFEEAALLRPHGMALADATTLYVADTGNHSLRRVDLEQRTVTTLAGTGEQEYLFGRTSAPASGGLNSPWDVLWHDGQLFIAMAGQHQIWRLEPGSDTLLLHAGSGMEALQDGPALRGGLNQPSGLATDGDVLFIADSEASAVRQVEVEPGGTLTTIVGLGLFEFGDEDGVGDAVRLQHPKALAYSGGQLYLADTYNHKIKRLDPATRESVTLLGTGDEGLQDGATARFYEPGGLSVAGGRLYIADTNNHAVRVADLATLEVSTLALSDPDGLLTRAAAAPPRFDEVVDLPASAVAAGTGAVVLELTLPDGYKANHLAPLQVRWSSDGAAVRPLDAAPLSVSEPAYPLRLELPAEFREGEALLSVDVVIYYCREVAAELCLIRQAQLRAAVEVRTDAGTDAVALTWQPPALPAGY